MLFFLLIFVISVLAISSAVASNRIHLPSAIADERLPEWRRQNLYLNTARDPAYHIKWYFDTWQVDDFRFVCNPNNEEVMLLRNRGGSKSRDGVMLAIYFGYQKKDIINYQTNTVLGRDWNRVLWYAASQDQLKAARDYFYESRYVDRTKSTMTEIYLWNNNIIKLKIMSKSQAASSRSDIIFFDEEQDMDVKIYHIALGTQVGGSCRKIHMGTTLMDSVLEDNFKRLNLIGLVLEHHIDECSWTTAEREIKKNFAGAPNFVIRSQLFCEWVRAGGLVFENVEVGYCNGPFVDEFFYGVDPNPKTGHALVGIKYALNGDIYVNAEYPAYRDSFAFIEILKDLCVHNANIEVEEQGDGIELMKSFHKNYEWRKDYYGSIWSIHWDEDKKKRRVFNIRTRKVIVNPNCKETLHHIRTAAWDEKEPKAKLQKTPEQHFLDAFLHACQMGDTHSVSVND